MCENKDCKCNEEKINSNVEELSEEIYETQEENSIDDRYVELEISKEIQRLDREECYFEGLPFAETDDKTFNEIIRDGEAYASFYSHLVLAGVHGDTASQLLMNYMTTRHNLEMNRIDVEKSKYQTIQIANNTL